MAVTTKRISRRPSPSVGARLARSGTEALRSYQQSYVQINEFLDFVLRMATQIERTEQAFRKVSADVADILPDLAKRNSVEWRGPFQELKNHRQFLLEVLLVRHVENYLNYLSSLLRIILTARPETLRSSEKIDLEVVFRHSTLEDLVKTVAERKVESLSYASFGDLSIYFKDKFGITLVSDHEMEALVEAIECRNISVHNRCVVNHRYLARVSKTSYKFGQVRSLGVVT